MGTRLSLSVDQDGWWTIFLDYAPVLRGADRVAMIGETAAKCRPKA